MAKRNAKKRKPESRGFTLLEVMLALALVTLVLGALTIAIDLHLRVLDSGRTEVEEAQLARAVLRRIADDLRSAVHYDPQQAEKLMPMMSSATAAAEDLAEQVGGGAGFDVEDFDSEDFEEEVSDRTSDLAGSTVAASVPGLFGNLYELQVDTSRLPRLDQFNGMLAADNSAPADRVSDVKTVTYYVIDNLLDGTTPSSATLPDASGLVRREMDRATTAFSAEMGDLDEIEREFRPLAPEVAAIQFLYFDGTEVVEEWDSQQRGGLPMAVEITLYVVPKRYRNAPAASAWAGTQSAAIDYDDLLVYRLLVHLPAAQPTTLEETSEESSEDEAEAEDSDAAFDLGAAGRPRAKEMS